MVKSILSTNLMLLILLLCYEKAILLHFFLHSTISFHAVVPRFFVLTGLFSLFHWTDLVLSQDAEEKYLDHLSRTYF